MILMAPATKNQVEKYLSNNKHYPLILLGDKGIFKSKIAEYIAKKLLNTDSLVHPDFLRVEPDNGNIRLEQLDILHRFSRICAVNSKYKIFLIEEANTMTINAQNSLLKILEDCNATNIFIFVAHEPLLDTIHSRCTTIRVKRPSDDEVREYLKENGETVDDLMLKIADHRLGYYYDIVADKKYVEDCYKIIKTFLSGQKKDLLEVFGVLKEKDQNNFYDSYSTEKLMLLIKYIKEMFAKLLYENIGCTKTELDYAYMKKKYSSNSILAIITYLQQHLERMSIKGQYTKNDFFDLIRYLIIN